MVESASEKGSRRSSRSPTRSAEPDIAVWSHTGDLAEQLAEEDSFQSLLQDDRAVLHRSGQRNHSKRVHYPPGLENDGSVFEKVQVPSPPPRRISRVERILASIMSPRSAQNAQIHGLVGKPLL